MAGDRWWRRGGLPAAEPAGHPAAGSAEARPELPSASVPATPGAPTAAPGVRPPSGAAATDPTTEVLVRADVPAPPPAPALRSEAGHPTTQLDPLAAAAAADPGALTQVIDRSHQDPGAAGRAPAAAPAPLLGRRAAAELGIYVGAGLVALAAGGVALRGWADWDMTMRVATVALTSVALLATGLFVRLPWRRRPGPERRRAVSGLLTTGVALALTATAPGLGDRQGSGSVAALHAVGAVLAMLLVAVVAGTPLSETGVLLAATWAAWLLVPAAPWTWFVIAGLGVAWAAVAGRLARGRRTAVVAGAGVALAASVGMAQGPMAWWVRAALAGVALFGLLAFLRGRANGWLALGAAAATALAASVAGGQLGPAPALLVGGLATMAVSAIALRSARRTG